MRKSPHTISVELFREMKIKPKQKSKFNNHKVANGSEVFDSRKEFNRYLELKQMARRGEIVDLQRQVKFEIIINCNLICIYIADFVYHKVETREYADGLGADVKLKTPTVEDVKGMKRGTAYQIFRLKKKLMLAVHNIEVKEI